ncbi:MAG: hypothetical protein WDN30_09440 [Pararobbsia sp.]
MSGRWRLSIVAFEVAHANRIRGRRDLRVEEVELPVAEFDPVDQERRLAPGLGGRFGSGALLVRHLGDVLPETGKYLQPAVRPAQGGLMEMVDDDRLQMKTVGQPRAPIRHDIDRLGAQRIGRGPAGRRTEPDPAKVDRPEAHVDCFGAAVRAEDIQRCVA